MTLAFKIVIGGLAAVGALYGASFTKTLFGELKNASSEIV